MIETERYLEKLHCTLIEILDYVVSICEANCLTYSLADGTVLGAYRHHGFIPWDDDLDIILPRADYEKLIDLIRNNNDPRFTLQNFDNERNYFLPFVKIRRNGTVFREMITDFTYGNEGIFIDVFPLDFVSEENLKLYEKRAKYVRYINHGLRYRACSRYYRNRDGHIKFFVDYIYTLPLRLFSYKKLLEKMNRMSQTLGTQETSLYVSENNENMMCFLMKKEQFFPVRKMMFEGKAYNVPGNTEEYLKCIYGDSYMTLPPMEQRVTHMPLKVEFSNEEN